MKPLWTKKSGNLSRQKKITQPLETKKMYYLGTKKITQPLRTKKSRNLSGQKEITQPLGTKNHTTSQ